MIKFLMVMAIAYLGFAVPIAVVLHYCDGQSWKWILVYFAINIGVLVWGFAIYGLVSWIGRGK